MKENMTKLQQKLYKRMWYLKNKDKIYQYNKNYIKKHLKWYLEYRKNYLKKYKYSGKEIYKKASKKYRKEHALEIKLYKKFYRQQNKDKITLYIKNYRKNINNRIKSYLISRIWHVLKKNSKSESTMKLLGCSIEQLKNHLESKFTKDMSFTNYGKWHIDHIVPCASFDLNKASEQKKCFYYTNLQPLCAKDNLSKGCKIL